MSEALVVQERGVARYDDPEMIKTLKDTVCKGATDSQFRMFVEICKSTGLNPFLKEIWYVPQVGVMAGRDGYLRVANENPKFDGMETTVDRDPQGKPIKATCKVWRKDRSHPISCEAYFSEYKKSSGVWNQYPSAMISKVAEVLALKRSFSINGVVTEEEIGNDEERGSHEAQQAVAERKIAEMRAQRPTRQQAEAALEIQGDERIIDIDPEPPALPAAEQTPFADPPPQRESKKQQAVNIKHALDQFKELRTHMCNETGSDKLYYTVIGRYGATHANEIRVDDMRAAYAELSREFCDWKSVQPMPGEAA